ncbi:MAG: glycoside hydrolase family 2 protein [Anaerolineae bacterium]|nr:hypothetical protein [Thermoflexales bacterium]MDW8408530.1 glycoside hydrolase family 2 protein [Anaerolineae bacterium]
MHTIKLDGNWRVAQVGKRGSIPAQVPGCVHMDLLAAGKIPDPFYRDNELKVQWIGEVDWVYSRSFTVPSALLQHERVLLRCEGLDTFAAITLNGAPAGRADNMFRLWEFDVKSLLKPGRNTIDVRFDSTIPYIQRRQAERPLPDWSAPHEIKGRAYVRKEPCNYGWDWGPVLITCGIWRPIALVAFSLGRLTGAHILQDHDTPGQVTLRIKPELERVGDAALHVQAALSFQGETVAEAAAPAGEPIELIVRDPHLWWPNNLGEQPLYDVRLQLKDSDGCLIDVLNRRIGLRTLILDRHPDRWGESFQFVVNGVPFFAKGGNWIPADTFAPRMTRERYRALLQSVKDANMNMLRVWGGGIYEHDDFYDLCDELGICVWQDFMFACSTYPTFDEAFMANVRAEAEDVVRRLRHHACLALWCGNNELEQGLVGPTWTERTMSWEDYGKLFDHLLPEVTRALDPQRSYWPASPHTPVGDRANYNDPTCGDAHLWDVWHGRKPFEWYRTCEHRFNSEFGFQSFPAPKTVYSYTEPQDRNVTTYVMELHQRSGIGNSVIMQYMLDWFRLPTSFEMTLYLSQILQGMAMKYAVEHWRRAMPRGMGTLYWQINDCWPVASWSSIDYHGRWKALHYMARRFYQPVLLSAVEDAGGKVDVYLTNDLRLPSAGRIAWQLTDLAGAVLARGQRSVSIQPLSSLQVDALDLSKQVSRHGPRNLLLWLDYADKSGQRSANWVTFARPKHLELFDPQIEPHVKSLGDNRFAVTLTAVKPALWTWLELAGMDAAFSDNFVHVYPGRPLTLLVAPSKTMTLKQFKKALVVRSLIDTYR